MSQFKFFTSVTAILILSSSLHSQITIIRDVRNYRSVVTHLIADQTITASQYKIETTEVAEPSPDWLAEQAMISASRSALLDGTITVSGLSSTEIFQALGPVMVGIGAIGMVYNFASGYSVVANISSRTYQFYLPVKGRYRIKCTLVGGIDSPNNKVKMVGPNGIVIDYQEQKWLNDGDHDFLLDIPQGSYFLTMSLGSGTSSVFHSAGTLKDVSLDDPSYCTWTAPVVVAGARGNLPANVGDISTYRVVFPGYLSNVPGLISGVVTYTNIRAAPQAILGSLDGSPLGTIRAINKPIHVIQPEIITLGQPIFDGITGLFRVQRTADYEYDIYPENYW